MAARYRSNAPRFVDETLHGEALIMDMVKGNYFSCLGASAITWNALKDGASVEEIAQCLASAYGVSLTDATSDVERFVGTLLSEEMLVELEPTPMREPTLAIPVAPGEYASLELERYTDLADLLLLDPVHDVSEAGWPHAAP